jgi:hypothetical protein
MAYLRCQHRSQKHWNSTGAQAVGQGPRGHQIIGWGSVQGVDSGPQGQESDFGEDGLRRCHFIRQDPPSRQFINQSVDHLLSFKDLFHVDIALKHSVRSSLEEISVVFRPGSVDVDDEMISAWMYSVKVNLPAKLCKRGLMILGCRITWICSNWWWPWWEEVRASFVAAAVAKGNVLIPWINNVIKTRCSKRYTPEYCQVLPE